MKILQKQNLEFDNKFIYFVRVDPEDVTITIKDILLELSNLSWLNKVSPVPLRKAFEHDATNVVQSLSSLFNDPSNQSSIKEVAGEYIVSVLAKKAVVDECKHLDVPLTELLGRKVSGNPGFDFYTEEELKSMAFCGEAKYQTNLNAYNRSFKQILEFIEIKKYISDIKVLDSFLTEKALDNLSNHIFGISAAFSSIKTMSTENLIENIKNNEKFKDLLNHFDSILLLAVDIA